MTNTHSVRVVLAMAGNKDEASKIARTLVLEHLAACVNVVGPVRSIYRWRGSVEEAKEYLLVAKTQARMYARLEQRVKELHSYEVPEVIALELAAGSRAYLDWVLESTSATFPDNAKQSRDRRPTRAER